MSVWVEAKAITELHWGEQWNDIAQGTAGEQPEEVHRLLSELSQAEELDDRKTFLRLKAQLASLPSWRGSKPILSDNLAAGSRKPTAAPIQLAFPT